ncbi:NDP-hexose methyltransferase [Arenicella chitinivorans]|uniref:NDP-hexose methyltransferase n=2 Tax=Arenicella chitinivorans TaxID=1329800 RepID=A0A918S2J3_9GAMM|nr:NDP-hexose methyltransferase [Arenicella chitinivorans]
MAWNGDFDATLVHYDGDYEETQAYSPKFQTFHRQFAVTLVESYQLRGKTVLEIGCGKGEFLTALLDAGITEAIGFDPSFNPKRARSDARLTVYQQLYPPNPSAKLTLPAIDFYLCKMTLEHVFEPREFLSQLRSSIGDHDCLMAIQVPALERILTTTAYWDVYYEHCNYFSADAVARLFSMCGFEVIQSETIFDDQYLNVVARPVTKSTRTTAPNPLPFTAFKQNLELELAAWRERLLPAATQNALLVWGAASKAVGLLSALPELKVGTTLVDINPHKHGTYLPATDLLIHDPQQLQNRQFAIILVANPIYLDEVATMLKTLRIDGDVIALK